MTIPAEKPKSRLNPVRVTVKEVEPAERVKGFGEVIIPYTREEAIAEAQRCIQCGKPWCQEACPIGQDARGYIKLIAQGNFDEAAAKIVWDNPLAACLTKVCYHFCEEACPVGKRGQPIAIRQLKRAAVDFGKPPIPYDAVPSNGMKVAIIGGGPSGIMAAWSLGKMGYEVTVFEASRVLGGLMTMSIPKYRLTKGTFEKDLERMKKLGIEFKLGVRVGRDKNFEDLFKSGFNAVFVAVGTMEPQGIKIPGTNLPGVYTALDMLIDINLGRPVKMGERVAVIGGGDVAMDSVRSALRLGAEKVTLVYRRSREEMPASDEEIAETQAEGIEFMFLTAPLEILGKDHVTGLKCQKMQLGEPDESGRRKPVPIPGSEFVLDADTMILAIGQQPSLKGIPEDLGIIVNKKGVIEGDPQTTATKKTGVYAGGGASVVHAMAAGKRAALAIDRYLRPQKAAA